MPLKPKNVTTAADGLYDLIKEEKEISFKDAAKKLKVPVQTIEAWATFLEEDGLLSVRYKLTTPYLTTPVPGKHKPKELKEVQPLFQDKLADIEIKSEIKNASELLDTAAESRSKGEFGMLEKITSDLSIKLKKIVDFLILRIEFSPQIKAELVKQLNDIEKRTLTAARLLKNNKFDEANTVYSDLQDKMRKLLEKTKQQYAEVKEETGADDKDIQRVLENTYSLLEQGKLEEAEENYNKIKRIFGVFSHKFFSQKSEMQDSILKLNRDLAVYSNKIKNQRMQEGSEKINQLLKLISHSLKQKQFSQATYHYLEIKKIFEWLPQGFLKEKRQMKEKILKVFEQIAKEREQRLHLKFSIMYKKTEELLKEIRKQLAENNLLNALETYKTIARIYSELPKGFMKEKFDLQNSLVPIYNTLSMKLESTTEGEMNAKAQKIFGMLANMKRQTEKGNFDEADKVYSEINFVFKKLPTGFISRKTELQEKIIEQYEKLLEKKDNKRTIVFKTSADNIEQMISLAYSKVKAGDYSAADSLYRQIKAAYVKLQPTDLKQREATRNKILALYRSILIAGPPASSSSKLQLPARPNIMESVENVHKKIEELKSLSKARVRQPVQ